MCTEPERFGLQYSIVSTKPKMLLIGMDVGETGYKIFGDGSTSLDYLSNVIGRDGYLFINPWWTISDSGSWHERLNSIRMLTNKRSSPGIYFFCNTSSEVEFLQGVGISAILMNHNTFCNENTFRILPEEKRFQAIYNAKMINFKRHELAKDVVSLALVYSKFGELANYFPRVLEILHSATFLNGDPRDQSYKMFSPEDVCRFLNQARVGLCLSRTEGAMYASIEYLLSGLPIVSTESVGVETFSLTRDFAG